MLSDGLTSLQADGKAREEVEVLDVAQLLLASVKRADAPATIATPPASQEPAAAAKDPEPDPEPGPEVEVAGGEDEPAERAAEEDQPGSGSEPGVNDPATDTPEQPTREPAERKPATEQDRLF
jgi:hypothetical protein